MNLLGNFKKTKNLAMVVAIATSILVCAATMGIALYSTFFVYKLFSPLLLRDELHSVLYIFESGLIRWVLASLILALVSSYYISKAIIRPLTAFIEASEKLSKGDFSHRFNPTSYSELNQLITTYNNMAENLESLYRDLESKVNDRTRELEAANKELMDSQLMIIHSEKMRSLGQLVAGITHEINNPINFIYGNLVHLQTYTNSLLQIISLYQLSEPNLPDEDKAKILALKESLEFDFIKEDLPMLIRSCYEGTERTKNIINDLKNFSRLDEFVVNDVNLPKEIDTTLNILHNKIKNRIEIIKEYDEDLNLVEGYGGQLNHVFMNIIDNAIYAIKDEGEIFIRLKNFNNSVIIEIEDTGRGISEKDKSKIFDPFYTTKPVGEGSGLGMSIAYQVIKNHNGKIEIYSKPSKGTKFVIELPLKMEKKIGVANDK